MHHNNSRTTVLTGATGFLGAFLMAGLLERGHHVTVLGRSSNSMGLSERLSGLLHWFGIDPGDRLYSMEVDFSKKHLGLDDHSYSRLCDNAGELIHCASDTSFSERNRARVMESNVNNISALMEFAADSHINKLFYISSAYAAGIQPGKCLEAPITGREFTNVYEESKAMAEKIISDACEENGIPLAILRPSIVFGHSKTGQSLKFNALYYVVKSLLMIRDIFIKDITEQGGDRSKAWGFSLDGDGVLHMALEIHLKNKGLINLIPIDYFVDAALSIIEDPASTGIYHITSDNPPDMSLLAEYSERYLKIQGVRLVFDQTNRNAKPNPAEELFDKFIEQYLPYLSDTRAFDRTRIEHVTQGRAVPPFTYEVFQRCMDYALENNWGKKEAFPH